VLRGQKNPLSLSHTLEVESQPLRKLCPTTLSYLLTLCLHLLFSLMKLFLILLLTCGIVLAEPGIFYNPPTGGPIHEYQDNPVYTLGKTVQLRWDTTLEIISIMLWQNDNSDFEWVQSMSPI
jgi:hypothetical protein